MLRRSDFIAATYALSFVLANFGIAIAARMPMMTTTIRSSMRVKPFLLRTILILLRSGWGWQARSDVAQYKDVGVSPHATCLLKACSLFLTARLHFFRPLGGEESALDRERCATGNLDSLNGEELVTKQN